MAKRTSQCVACSSRHFSQYSKDLVKCQDCGLVVASDIPTDNEIKKLYQQDYFFGMEYSDYLADRQALEHNFRKRLKRLDFMLDQNFFVAEVGCAYGYFLNLIRDRTKKHVGFDVTEDGVRFAKNELGLNATTDEFLKYPLRPSSVDSVFMWDVVEHLTHPDAYLKRVSEVLKPGGHVALTTGNIESWLARKRGAKWRMIHPPTHVYYFSPKTLDLLFRKYGLETVSVKHTSVSRNVGSVFNQLIANKKALKKRATALQLAHKVAATLGLDKLNIPLNTFDIMEVVARKA